MPVSEDAIRRGGFTLMEVVVGLAVASLLLLSAHGIISAAGDGAARVTAERIRTDQSANAERLMRDLVGRAELRFQRGYHFRGDGRAARWSTWCDTSGGWLERCEVTLALLTPGDRNVLAVALPDGLVFPVRANFRDGNLLYLRSAANGGAWAPTWDSETALPLAIGVRIDSDTLILRIGERG